MFKREDFTQYKAGMSFKDFSRNKVPLCTMEHLRQLDYAITKGISYERTAYTFLAQLELSSRLNAFKVFHDAVILLNEEGAMIRHKNEWDLIFTPDRLEQTTLAEDADLYPVYEKLMEELKEGKKCKIRLNRVTVRSLLANTMNLNILDNYCRNYPGGYLAVAEKVVVNGTDELYSNVPVCRYGGLTTVDLEERESYDSINGLMKDYIYAVDNSNGKPIRPLSIAVFGAPGSGKSYGVKQIAKSYERYDVFTLNLSQYNTYEEMLKALDHALESAKDIPLIFFDEFDSEYMGASRGWLKFLLAPMQDGEYTIGGKIKTINNGVFVFAGGTASSFKDFLPKNDEEQVIFKKLKGPDFVSRLRGTLNIKGPNPTSITDKSYIIRRAILLRDMIIRKVPQIYDKNTKEIRISKSLLSALLRTTEYRHGTRSMEFLLDMSRLSDATKFTPSCLPMLDQMDIHIDYRDLSKKLSAERVSPQAIEQFISNMHELLRSTTIQNEINKGMSPEDVEEFVKENPEYAKWEVLGEEYKQEYHLRFKRLLEGMEDFAFPLGMRPSTEGMPDTVNELFGTTLEMMTKLDHQVWLQNMLENGWRYSPTEDPMLLLSPDIRQYEELTRTEQELKQSRMVRITEYLRAVGLEIYRKSY